MSKTKTTFTDNSVTEFIQSFTDSEQKRADSFALIEMMKEVSGHEPVMWGPSIIGFGRYHYKYKTGHEGDAPLLGFSPRKAAISLYVYCGVDEHKHLLDNLGKFTMGKVCIYVKKLSDIDQDSLIKLMKVTLEYMRTNYTTN